MKKVYFILIACMLLTIVSTFSASGQVLYADEEGYAGTTLSATYQYPFADTFVWSATWEGSCDRWYIWPNGNRADISFYFTLPQQEGGVLSVECKRYKNNILQGTDYWTVYVYPEE